ncbi:hypothetical protein BDFB_012941 [Asbolus verrucosus]|uniref:Uncharacterized protein n=1 Tax=Asbolus verrucosus TaxID=1661398 RepID=A0A482W398_ASBVE|nr:hypothetical protein BDFB_012941 [Asbolus verrucosus]
MNIHKLLNPYTLLCFIDGFGVVLFLQPSFCLVPA